MKDKIIHSVVSASLVWVFVYLFRSIELAMFLSLMAGIGKEVYDEVWGSGFDGKDLLADIVGIGIGVIVWMI